MNEIVETIDILECDCLMAIRRDIVKTGLILDHVQKRGSMMDDDKKGRLSWLHPRSFFPHFCYHCLRVRGALAPYLLDSLP
jgi:hypothetical protein